MSVLPFTGEAMPLRSGDHKPTEKLAKEEIEKRDKGSVSGVGWHDSQPWIPPVKTPIVYPEGKKTRQLPVPMESAWSTFEPWCYPVCRHTADQCPTKPQYPAKTSWERGVTRAPNPEGHKLPDGSVINKMTFDEQPWLDSEPIEVQAKAGYTNFSNDLIAKGDLLPGEYWARADRKHRRAGLQRAADASQPPTRVKDSLSGLQGRCCKSCLGRVPEGEHGRVRYCSERCRNRSENQHRRGLVGSARKPTRTEGMFDSWEFDRVKTISEDVRLKRPWAGEPKVWRIVAKAAELAEDARRIPCRFALSPVIVHLPGNQQRQDWKIAL